MTNAASPGGRKARRATPPAATPGGTLRIVEQRVYRGPNFWSYEPAIKLIVDLGPLEEYPTNKLPGFTEKLLATVPGVAAHSCGTGRPGGFQDRLRDGTWLGHVAEHIALQVQRDAGTEVGRGKTRSTGQPGRYHVIYTYAEESVGLAAGRLAVRLVNHLVEPDPTFDYETEFEQLIRLAERAAFGPSTQALLDEANLRDIPWIRLNEASLVQLGHGVHQKRIRATMTSHTSALGVDIAQDKKLTNRLLAATGVPVPRAEVVRGPEEAVTAAGHIGYPVAIKPLDGNHGRGVMLNLGDEAAVRAAYPIAREESRFGGVVVESYLVGNDYRCLVVGGVLRAVAQRLPAHVDGDGKHTVSELVDITNADPRRGIGHEKVLTRIAVDDESVSYAAEQGFALDAVPPKGTRVFLKRTGNMSTGGISIDRTEEIHPENAEIAEQAAKVVGLDIAGIDFVCPDISVPVRETGGGIVEVNAAPGFRMHTNPTEGEAQYVAKPVLDILFPPGTPVRIPIVAVTGTNGKTTTARMISHILKGMGRKVGMTSTDGIFIDGRMIRRGDMSGPKSASMVLQNPLVDTAVFEVARGGILREGLGYQRNEVAVVLNVAADHLGLGGINSLRQLAGVKQVIVEAVPRSGTAVLNADDPLVSKMAAACSGAVIYFSMNPDNDTLRRQASRGRRSVTLEQGRNGEMIVLRQGRKSLPLVWTHLIPATFEGRARMNVANALAATARGMGRRRSPARHSPGVAHVLDLVLPGARPDEPVRPRRLPGPGRLRPQPTRHDRAGVVHRRGVLRGVERPQAAGHRQADRGRGHGRRPARPRHPRAGPGGRRLLRSDRHPRGREHPRTRTGCDGGAHPRGHHRRDGRRGALPQGRDRARRAGGHTPRPRPGQGRGHRGPVRGPRQPGLEGAPAPPSRDAQRRRWHRRRGKRRRWLDR